MRPTTTRLALFATTLVALAPVAVAQEEAPQTTSLFEAFFVQRHADTGNIELLGTAIIWLLLALSAVCVGLIISIALETKREKFLPDQTLKAARTALGKADYEGGLKAVSSDESFFARVLHAALTDAPSGFGSMIRGLDQTAEELTIKRLRKVEPLNVIGGVAPMVGLFGTVYGMILAFREIVAAGGTPNPVGLAAGIGTALTTTFWGLVVAIPALAGYALLRNKIDALTVEATREAEELINRFKPTTEAPTAEARAAEKTKVAKSA
ncbi:MAG: MotA/TolQ/ExbB proton channel family protein [bacterium]|nr:MotA/TolQ/ExbB proton channel family protein [bacterium]